MTSSVTQKRWEAFKEKRAAQHRRDEYIKLVIRDFIGLVEIIGCMAIAWFCLACAYA